MCWTSCVLALVFVGNGVPGAIPASPRYVESRQLIVSYEPASSAEVRQAHLWVSTDGSETWKKASAAQAEQHTLRFEADCDGKYCFYLVLENDVGQSADPPTPDAEPHITVIVDTAPPTLQIREARQITLPDGSQGIRLHGSLIDENLGRSATRLFYRAKAAGWQDGGTVVFADGSADWCPPGGIGPRVDLRIVATDRAGNRAIDEIRNVPVEPSTPVGPPDETGPRMGTDETRGPIAPDNAALPPVEPPSVAPVLPVTATEMSQPPPATQRSPRVEQQLKRLRELANRYLAEGRLSLASARLRDARELAPDNPGLLVDLGSVLFRARRYDEADHLFQDALADAPEHLGAIEGLALVAATQKRYPQARAYLERLLRISPESTRHWLRYGDIQHLLGNSPEAYAAWENVLKLEATDQSVRRMAERRLELFRPKNAAPE